MGESRHTCRNTRALALHMNTNGQPDDGKIKAGCMPLLNINSARGPLSSVHTVDERSFGRFKPMKARLEEARHARGLLLGRVRDIVNRVSTACDR